MVRAQRFLSDLNTSRVQPISVGVLVLEGEMAIGQSRISDMIRSSTGKGRLVKSGLNVGQQRYSEANNISHTAFDRSQERTRYEGVRAYEAVTYGEESCAPGSEAIDDTMGAFFESCCETSRGSHLRCQRHRQTVNPFGDPGVVRA